MAETCMCRIAGFMCRSSNPVSEESHISTSEENGEWEILGLMTLKASNRNPANPGAVGDKYSSSTRSLYVNLSDSIGTYDKGISQ